MAFPLDQIWVLLIDRVLISGIGYVAWLAISERLKAVEELRRKEEQVREREIARKEKEELRMRDEADRASALQAARLYESQLQELDRQRARVERELREFLAPVAMCLSNDDAVWQRVPHLNTGSSSSQLPEEVAHTLEREFMIPNHDRAVAAITASFDLTSDDSELREGLVKYVRHVAVYKAIRVARLALNPVDVGEPFPKDLHTQIQRRIVAKTAELETLNRRRFHLANQMSDAVAITPLKTENATILNTPKAA
jgi:hypothetical protein